jgi:hypothetical protein
MKQIKNPERLNQESVKTADRKHSIGTSPGTLLVYDDLWNEAEVEMG